MSESAKPKLALAVASLVIGVSAFLFAVFGWTQTGAAFTEFARNVCLVGSMGATVLGSLMLNDVKGVNQTVALSAKKGLDFLALSQVETDQSVSIEV